jgi:hypothetical protein
MGCSRHIGTLQGFRREFTCRRRIILKGNYGVAFGIDSGSSAPRKARMTASDRITDDDHRHLIGWFAQHVA